MSTTLNHRARFPFPAEELLEIVTSRSFVEARERLQGAVELRVDVSLPVAGGLRVSVHRVRVVDEGGETSSARSRVVEDWDLAARSCAWRLETEHGQRVRIEGLHVVEGDAGGCWLTTRCEVTVHISEMGPRVEQAIAARLQGNLAAAEALVRQGRSTGALAAA